MRDLGVCGAYFRDCGSCDAGSPRGWVCVAFAALHRFDLSRLFRPCALRLLVIRHAARYNYAFTSPFLLPVGVAGDRVALSPASKLIITCIKNEIYFRIPTGYLAHSFSSGTRPSVLSCNLLLQ